MLSMYGAAELTQQMHGADPPQATVKKLCLL